MSTSTPGQLCGLSEHEVQTSRPTTEMNSCHHLKQIELDSLRGGICISYLSSKQNIATAGTILQRCLSHVSQFRNRMGRSVCVFKLGMTSNPLIRFEFYKEANYTHMTLLHVSDNLGAVQMLEAALISANVSEKGCRNQKYGGEGPPCSQKEPYHFVYVVGARADQFKPIRWSFKKHLHKGAVMELT